MSRKSRLTFASPIRIYCSLAVTRHPLAFKQHQPLPPTFGSQVPDATATTDHFLRPKCQAKVTPSTQTPTSQTYTTRSTPSQVAAQAQASVPAHTSSSTAQTASPPRHGRQAPSKSQQDPLDKYGDVQRACPPPQFDLEYLAATSRASRPSSSTPGWASPVPSRRPPAGSSATRRQVDVAGRSSAWP